MPEQPFSDIAPWPPTRWTEPLSDDFPSAFDPFADLMQAAWVQAFGYALEEWQVSLLRAVLELFPEGHPRAGQMRWMQVVISLGRQNGKSEIAAALALWQLVANRRSALIAGIATSVKQAGIVYERARTIIDRTSLSRSFKATGTRGITSRSPGAKYTMEPAKSASLQGIPITLGLVDELHILKSALWTDLVNGAGGRPNCPVVGITTAGDDHSELLIHLYEQGAKSILDAGANRVGFFVWEAPEPVIPEDDEMLARYLAWANPGVASGRRDLENLITKVRTLPSVEVIRYDLNRFIASVNVFIPPAEWARGATGAEWPSGVRPTFTITRTQDWRWATIQAFAAMPDGSTYCDVVASVPINAESAIRTLADIASKLSRHNPITFGMAWETLGDLGKELKNRGIPVRMIRSGDMVNGSSLFLTKVLRRKIKHPGNPLLSFQIPKAMIKSQGDGFRVSVAVSKADIDAVVGCIEGVYMVDTHIDAPMQIF